MPSSFDPFYRFCHPLRSLIISIPIGSFGMLLGFSLFESCLWAVACYLLGIAFWIDRCWVKFTPLTPLTALALASFARFGIGLPVLAYASNNLYVVQKYAGNPKVSAMLNHVPEVQLLWLVFLLSILFWFIVIPPKPRTNKIAYSKRFYENGLASRSLITFVIFSGLFSFSWILIGFISGTLDRNPEIYFHWVNKIWRPDSLFVAFARLRDIFFFLVPAALFVAKRLRIKVSIYVLAIGYLFIASLLGGRGVVMAPALWLLLGLGLVKISFKRLAIYIVSFALLVVFGMQAFRAGSAYAPGERNNLLERASNVVNVMSTKFKSYGIDELTLLGVSTYGCSDALNFTPGNLESERSGWVRIERIPMAWLPKTFFPAKQSARDAHIIAEELGGTSRQNAENKIYTSHECVNYSGDLFWRGGWGTVVIGSLLFGLFYRGISKLWVMLINIESPLGWFIIGFPASFLSLFPAGSLGETAWLWMWDIPKYIILSILIWLTNKALLRQPSRIE